MFWKTKKTSIERTRVITAKITIIESITADEANSKITKKEKMQAMEEQIKKALKADDVKVSNVQDFLLDKQ